MDLNDVSLKIAVKVVLYMNQKQNTERLILELIEQQTDDDILQIEFLSIPKSLTTDKVFKTPSSLEKYLVEQLQHLNTKFDFIFMEWTRLEEDILITNEKSAYIKTDCG